MENESLLVLPKLEVVHPLHNGRLSSGQSLERSEQVTILCTRDSNGRLWGAKVEPPRVLGIREQRNEAQRLRIGEGRGENLKNSHKGVGWCEFRTRELSSAKFPVSWAFSLVFPCFPLDFILQALLPVC